VADLPENLAKVLEELESRKKSLRGRLESLDNAIDGIQRLRSLSDDSRDILPDTQTTAFALVDSPIEDESESPVREDCGTIQRSAITRSSAEPETTVVSRNGIVIPAPVSTGRSWSPAEKTKPLNRPLSAPPPSEGRRRNHLNIYVNRNAEWASKQFVGPKSPRALFRHKTGQRCPQCGSQDTRLSLTKGVADCLMFLFDYSIARCRNCDTRFRIWRSRDEEEGETELEVQPAVE
jgi:hypothetical protein